MTSVVPVANFTDAKANESYDIGHSIYVKIAPQRRTQRFVLVAFNFPGKIQIYDVHGINPKQFGTWWSDLGGQEVGKGVGSEGHETGRILFWMFSEMYFYPYLLKWKG